MAQPLSDFDEFVQLNERKCNNCDKSTKMWKYIYIY